MKEEAIGHFKTSRAIRDGQTQKTGKDREMRRGLGPPLLSADGKTRGEKEDKFHHPISSFSQK